MGKNTCSIIYITPSSTYTHSIDMISAHSSYWGDPSLAAFILAEIFARKGDSARTDIGLSAAVATDV